MSKPLLASVTGCATILLAAMLTTPAAARIQCRGNFQMTKYGPIATPYCEEEQIAFVARSYGQRVTAAEVHNNPLTKVYLCQTIGYDFSVEGILCGLRTGLLRPRSLTVARTRGVLNDCPTRHPARLRRSWSRTSVARGSAKDGLRVWAWSRRSVLEPPCSGKTYYQKQSGSRRAARSRARGRPAVQEAERYDTRSRVRRGFWPRGSVVMA